MAPGGRTPFTTDDDTLLVKYLAKYNPGVQGRSGNKIYQILVENEHNKWSWSARHPWGGWRERYTRHQDEFNARIKKYQTKKGLPMENSIYGNSTQKLKGSDEEAEPKRKRKQKASDEEEEIEITERKRTQDDEDEVMEEPKRKRKQRSSDEEEEEIMEEPKRKRTSADARKRAKVDVEENGADSPPRDDDDEMPEYVPCLYLCYSLKLSQSNRRLRPPHPPRPRHVSRPNRLRRSSSQVKACSACPESPNTPPRARPFRTSPPHTHDRDRLPPAHNRLRGVRHRVQHQP
ncbi:hypothetical protein DFH09DRAFT_329962 [Mycena vulgaris]|nr:hypothetical protein DFH09DRAFT_329962 [Mycena vulgaris]